MIFQLIAAQSRRRISVPCSGGRALEIALINERLLNARNVISGEVLMADLLLLPLLQGFGMKLFSTTTVLHIYVCQGVNYLQFK